MEENSPDVEVKQSKKKRNRASKKSLVAENENRQKFLDTLLHDDNLPPYIEEVLKLEDQEKGYLCKLSTDDIERLWHDLKDFVRDRVNLLLTSEDEKKDEIREVIAAAISLLQYTTIFHHAVESESFAWLASALNCALPDKNTGEQLRNKISELCEYCCTKEIKVHGEFYLNTFNYLFDATLDDRDGTDRKAEIKRMWEMHVALARLNLRTQSCEPIVGKLARAIVSPAYLSCKEGRQFIAFSFTLDIKLIKKFHQAVKDFLPSCKKPQAVAYGEIYYNAWVNGSVEVRQELEKQCIQNLMTHMFLFPRKKQEISHLGQNVFAILSYLHNHRTISHFSKVLTELYMPLLWRHLRSGSNVERCNAAMVFLDMYPLEKPGSGKAEESDFYDKQHNEMVDLLTDNCHIVRIIAIKGICSKLCTAWRTFPQETIQVLMRNLIALASDGSCAIVRSTLYDSLRDLLLNPESATYLARVLPSLRDYVHDENERVRRSFVKLLCDIKNMPSPAPITYWKVVPLNHLAARLELENAEVGSVLCKLMMSSIYTPEYTADRFLSKIIRLIETSPVAARKLFQFSSKVLDYKGALRIMLTILLNLRAYVKEKEAEGRVPEEQEEKKEASTSKKKKKRRSVEPLQTVCENDQEDEGSMNKENDSCASNTTCSSENKEEDEYGRPEISHALIDIVTLLWSMHSTKLADPDNQLDHDNLLDCACAGIPLFLRYYKGSVTYFAVIHLASLVPPSKLTPVSTVCSASAASLKTVSEMTPQGEIDVLIHALCAWNRWADIQDLVVDWLDQAFRCEGLNQSNAKPEEYKQRKVRFIAKGGKPMLALKLLDAVFVHPLNKKRVLSKSYNQVYELYTYMERIKTLVERRLVGGLPLDSPMLGDDFLLKCFYRYCKLILILHRPDPQTSSDSRSVIESFDASEVFQQVLQWALVVIRPMIPQRLEDEPDISVLFFKDILRTAANLVDINYAQKDTIFKLAALIKELLSTECSLWYVEPSMVVVKHLKDYAEAFYGPQDEDRLLRTVIPSLLSQALRSLCSTKYTKEQVSACVQNMYELKTSIYEVVNCLRRLFGPHSQLLQSVLKLFTDAIISVISNDISQLQILDTVDKIQDLPFACGILLSIVSRAPIAPLWLATVPMSISQLYYQDADLLAAAVSLLHTLVRSGLSLPQQELRQALREAYTTINAYSRESVTKQPLADTSNLSDTTFSTHSIDVKKVAPPILSELAAFLNCTLR